MNFGANDGSTEGVESQEGVCKMMEFTLEFEGLNTDTQIRSTSSDDN